MHVFIVYLQVQLNQTREQMSIDSNDDNFVSKEELLFWGLSGLARLIGNDHLSDEDDVEYVPEKRRKKKKDDSLHKSSISKSPVCVFSSVCDIYFCLSFDNICWYFFHI